MMRHISTGWFTFIILPLFMLLTGCNSEEGSGSVIVKSGSTVTLERIVITPSPLKTRGVSQPQLAAGNELPFHAIGHYSDGSSRTLMGLNVNGLSESDTHLSDWHTSEQEVAVFSAPGMLKGGKTPGLVKVNLIKDNITSNTVKVNVTAAVIEDITITPASIALAKGQTEPLTAMANYSDGTTSDVTTFVAWQSPSPSTANVTPTGLISGGDVGITTITATKDGVPSNTVNVHVTTAVIDDITITPANVSVAKGQTQPLTATAIYSDGSSSNITSSVAWQDDSPATPTVTITPTGVLSGVDVGTANLSATKDGVPSNTVNVNVTAAVIEGITITPASIALAKGQTEPLTAMATYSDGTTSDVTTSVAWQSPSPSTANVTPTGLISGGDVGITTITATKDGVPSNTVNVHVTTAVIDDITITPANVSVAKGQTQPLTATAIYSDGSSSNITSSVAWQDDSPSTATPTVTITPTGVLSGVDVGTANLSATKDGVPSNTVNVNVTAAVIEGITITPASIALAKGQTEPLTAMATYSDGTTSDVTTSVAWQSPSPSTANVTPTGLISGGDVGITTITATKDGVPGNTVNVHVTTAVIDDITITPANVSVAKGQTEPLTAMATYSDGTTSDVTSSVAWSVSRPTTTTVATVTSGGLVSGVDMGLVTVTAMKDGVPSNDVDINVTAAVIDAIDITPASITLKNGQTEQLTAIVTYSDGTTSDVTSSVAWQSYPTSTANVTPTGLVSGLKTGTANVSATKDGTPSNTITVEVCNLADTCIDVFDTGRGRLYTSSPSVDYLSSIGGSPTDASFTETGTYGPAGRFYRFSWSNAGLLCAKYSTQSLSGRTNWRLPSRAELKVDLFDKYGTMFTARGWPASVGYWSSYLGRSQAVNLTDGKITGGSVYYVSCVSDKPLRTP